MGKIFPEIGRTYYIADDVDKVVKPAIVIKSGMPRVGEVDVLVPCGDFVQGWEMRVIPVSTESLCWTLEAAIHKLLGAYESTIRYNTAKLGNEIGTWKENQTDEH